jgi:DNA-binding PadR family transcriptional regulator
MHKEVLILGLLRAGPRTGYDLHRIVVAHGELYTDLKKGNVYYLLERLTQAGALSVTSESGAPGPLRERRIYALTDEGRERFAEMLRDVVRTYDLAYTGVEVGVSFLSALDPREAVALLVERRRAVLDRRAVFERETRVGDQLHVQLARDHLLSLMDAELGWIERTLQRLGGREEDPADSAPDDTGSSPEGPAVSCA